MSQQFLTRSWAHENCSPQTPSHRKARCQVSVLTAPITHPGHSKYLVASGCHWCVWRADASQASGAEDRSLESRRGVLSIADCGLSGLSSGVSRHERWRGNTPHALDIMVRFSLASFLTNGSLHELMETARSTSLAWSNVSAISWSGIFMFCLVLHCVACLYPSLLPELKSRLPTMYVNQVLAPSLFWSIPALLPSLSQPCPYLTLDS